jgi:hypothetical protein
MSLVDERLAFSEDPFSFYGEEFVSQIVLK